MTGLYNAVVPLLRFAASAASLFNAKLRRAIKGRKRVLAESREHYKTVQSGRPRLLIHVASFGELEQAKPVIAELRRRIPSLHVHLTFFSPSGYENAIGKYPDADVITYIPFDTRKDVRSFLDIAKPAIVLFTKYDVWPNFAFELQRRGIPTVLFAATAGESSKRMQGIMRTLHESVYRTLTRTLTISEKDRGLFLDLGLDSDRVAVAGDTRFDQVVARASNVATSPLPPAILSRIEKKNTLVFVLGSAWQTDEDIIKHVLKQSIKRGDNILTIIAPHEPTSAHIARLQKEYGSNMILLSEITSYERQSVIVVDSIGKLFGLYSLADLAMVGGGFGAGVHNTLEAAVWGAPVICGPKRTNAQEVDGLLETGAAYEVKTPQEFEFVFWQLVRDEELRERAGEKAKAFVRSHVGATHRIADRVTPLLHQERS